jgi:ribosomal protein L16 Arg81 hydroxylase
MPVPNPAKVSNTSNLTSNERSQWFDSFIGTLRAHEMQLETQTATPQVQSLYQNLLSGNVENVVLAGKQQAKEFFVTKIIVDYFTEIQNISLAKLAFDHNDSEVLVWIQISDNDFESENKLILAEAKVNARYHEFGYHICSVIVETSDQLPIPNHYKVIK